jgi:hypothetical protein
MFLEIRAVVAQLLSALAAGSATGWQGLAPEHSATVGRRQASWGESSCRRARGAGGPKDHLLLTKIVEKGLSAPPSRLPLRGRNPLKPG